MPEATSPPNKKIDGGENFFLSLSVGNNYYKYGHNRLLLSPARCGFQWIFLYALNTN